MSETAQKPAGAGPFSLFERMVALRYLRSRSADWTPQAVTVSAVAGTGLAELWQQVEEHRERLTRSGELLARRRAQLRHWMWSLIEERLLTSFRSAPAVQTRLESAEHAVVEGTKTPAQAAAELLELFGAGR